MTSKFQPMDVGIFRTMKLKYQKRMVSRLLRKMDECEMASQLAKQTSVLDAIQWMQKVWQEAEKSTIRKCYKKCSFSIDVPTNEEETEAPEEAYDNNSFISKVQDDVFIDEFVSFDDNTTTTQTLADIRLGGKDVWEAKGDAQKDVPDSDLESDLEEDEGQTTVTWKEAQLSISHLSQFSLSNGLENL